MANNLGKLRKEFKMTQTDLADMLSTSTTNVGYYEQEKRDFSTKLLIKLADYFKVSIDYLLGFKDSGVFVYYEGDTIIEYSISEDKLSEYIKSKVIYYKDDSYKRYININQLLGLPNGYDLSNIMEQIYSLDELEAILPTLPLENKDDLDKLYSISKIKSIDKDKAHAIKKILEYL